MQANNTEAIRENGGVISLRRIISADSSVIHNLRRFNYTPRGLILGQLQSVCLLVGLCTYFFLKKELRRSREILALEFVRMHADGKCDGDGSWVGWGVVR